ncbi:hypothetical protein RMP42_05813 (plasmid) [Roseomonas mucosa]|nr:hypothetical protein RMP42_05813 [Roseomonas mucosa]
MQMPLNHGDRVGPRRSRRPLFQCIGNLFPVRPKTTMVRAASICFAGLSTRPST